MNSQQWDTTEELIEQALNLPPEEVERFLDESCRGNDELRTEVESLLSSSKEAFDFFRDFSGQLIHSALDNMQNHFPVNEPLNTDEQLGHFKILEESGSGGMGVVYKAKDLRLDRYVAIKLLPNHLNSDSSAKTQFISEAKAVSALDHPNICTLHDISETDAEHLYMTMAWYEGETLRQKLKKGAIEPRQAIDYAIQAADGLAAAHQAGITHRDIKPSNIMITDEGLVKILDFGIAKTLQSDGRREKSVMGSPAYMSPEQVRRQQIDHRSDIWSLGVVLYEMLTGKQPYTGETDAEMLHALLKEAPAPMEAVHDELEQVVMKCLEKDPEERYQHIGELKEELFENQLRIVPNNANKLHTSLASLEKKMPEDLLTVNPQAYHFFMQAREYLGRPKYQIANPLAAEQLLKRSLHEDSQFAHAWALLAITYSDLYWFHGQSTERLEQIREAAEQAKSLAPDLAETMLAQGIWHYWSSRNYENTLSLLKEALKHFPNYPVLHQFIALTHRRLGNWDEVENHFIQAIELDPRNLNYYHELAFLYYLKREYNKALSTSERGLEFSPDMSSNHRLHDALYALEMEGTLKEFEKWREEIHPLDPVETDPLIWGYFYYYQKRDWDQVIRSFKNLDSEIAWEIDAKILPRDYVLAIAFEYKNEKNTAQMYYKQARLILEEQLQKNPDDPRYRAALGRVYVRMGEPEKAIREGKKAMELMPLSKNAHEGAIYEQEMAYIYAWAGEHEKAIDKLELLLSIPSMIHKNQLRLNPDWDPLREHPRFQTLIAETD